ncbi:DMT family transporter [Cytobacillus sp. FJAT-54145]|uniref:DMT family transporter n=1 Tax=Cytobacillus spartinae TaxID=3299023 RepID=A0ABW6K6Z3_9BACI
MYTMFLLFALTAGLAIGIHGVINSSGAKAIGLPTMLAFFSIIQAIPAFIFLLIKQPSLGLVVAFTEGWGWFVASGLIGATIVTVVTLSISKIGALTSFVLVVLGQIIASAVADHFGFMGIEVKPMNLLKLLSIFIILGGVVLLLKGGSTNQKVKTPNVDPNQLIKTTSQKIS